MGAAAQVEDIGQHAAEQEDHGRVEDPEEQTDESAEDSVEEVVSRIVNQVPTEQELGLMPERCGHGRSR